MRRAALATLAFVLFLYGPVPTAQALDGSDWTLTPTRGGVKIALHITGEGTITYFRVNREFHSSTVLEQVIALEDVGFNHNFNSHPLRRIYFDTAPTAGSIFTYTLSVNTQSVTKTVTPIARSAPDQPAGFAATADNGQVTLGWTNPSDPSIQRYEYRQKSGGGNYPSSWTAIPNSDDTTISYTVPSLSNGTAYTFQIRAVNTQGGSTASADRTATPAGATAAPAAPTPLTLTPGDGQIQVSWNAPAANGAVINDYDVRYRRSSVTAWTAHPHSGTGRSTVITGLINGQDYQVQVRAKNNVGPSDWSSSADGAPVAPSASVLAKPTDFTAAAGNAQVVLTWTDPSDTSITKWQYQQKENSNSYGNWTDILSSHANTTSHTVASLSNGVVYTFRLRAVNMNGNGAASDEASTIPAARSVVALDDQGPGVAFGKSVMVEAAYLLRNDVDSDGFRNGEELGVTAVSAPRQGAVTLNADTSITFTHAPPPARATPSPTPSATASTAAAPPSPAGLRRLRRLRRHRPPQLRVFPQCLRPWP